VVEGKLSHVHIANLQKATQTALGVSPGMCVHLCVCVCACVFVHAYILQFAESYSNSSGC
jgi:hypothetical protein